MTTNTNNKILLFIPLEYKSMFLELSCIHKQLLFLDELPVLTMEIVGNDINCRLDKKCPDACPCEDKITHFKILKKQFGKWWSVNKHIWYKVVSS